tara:strand:+ start:603 stop:926 length:324 start_codon:yes stop_codon:yes gene_type:complete
MGKYTDKAEFKIPRHIVLKGGVNIANMENVITLTYASSQIQILSNGSGVALDLYLPKKKEGANFWIRSNGANAIHVRDSTTTYQILTTNKYCYIVSDGSNWSVLVYG